MVLHKLASAYGWGPRELDDLTDAQVEFLFRQITRDARDGQ